MIIHFLLSQIEKNIYENMKKKIIDYLIDYACPIISDNRLWNFSDCTSLSVTVAWPWRTGMSIAYFWKVTPADVNSRAHALPPVHLQRFTGEKLYEVWTIRSNNSNLLWFSAHCVVLFCMTMKVVWKGCPFISFETVNFLQKIDHWNGTMDITACKFHLYRWKSLVVYIIFICHVQAIAALLKEWL